jgi:PEP-CTERM motif
MKTQLGFASLAILFLVLAAIFAGAQTYNNGPCNCDNDAFTINSGYIVSDTFTGLSKVGSFSFTVWANPGYDLGASGATLDWSISSQENGTPVLGGSGTAQGGIDMQKQFVSNNAYGYDIDTITVSGLNVTGLSAAGSYWLSLQNAFDPNYPNVPVYWDENSGVGCTGDGHPGSCPSLASESAYGTIASEAFTISEGSGSTPEPSSIVLLGSGVLGLGGLLRRRFLG